MARTKKKWKYDDLEDHVSTWATTRIEELREHADDCYVDRSLLDEEKEFTMEAIAHETFRLLELMQPIEHSHQTLYSWAQDFVEEYKICANTRDD